MTNNGGTTSGILYEKNKYIRKSTILFSLNFHMVFEELIGISSRFFLASELLVVVELFLNVVNLRGCTCIIHLEDTDSYDRT